MSGTEHGDAGVRFRELRTGLVEISARRGQEPALDAALHREFGLSLPVQGGGSEKDGVAALWMGPAMTLIVAPPERLHSLFRNMASSVAAVVDQSGGFVMLSVEGPSATALLAKGCRLDLVGQSFPKAGVARTVIAQISVLLYRIGDTKFEVVVPATFVRSFTDFIRSAGAEFGCVVLPPVQRNGAASHRCATKQERIEIPGPTLQ